MTLRHFIRKHRSEIDAAIRTQLPYFDTPWLDDDERRLWVLNDEGLYKWARQEGVNL